MVDCVDVSYSELYVSERSVGESNANLIAWTSRIGFLPDICRHFFIYCGRGCDPRAADSYFHAHRAVTPGLIDPTLYLFIQADQAVLLRLSARSFAMLR